MSELWFPGADRSHVGTKNGGSMTGEGREYGTFHVTAGTYYNPNTTLYYGHENWPHMTIDRNGKVYQHLPANVAARALKNLSGGIQTNRLGRINFQIEVVAQPTSTSYSVDTWIAKAQRVSLARVVKWLRDEWEVPIQYPARIAGSYSAANKLGFRFSGDEVLIWSGWLGHQHWPENEHWDPGLESIVDIWANYGEEDMAFTPEEEAFLKEMIAGFVADGGNARTLRYMRRRYVVECAHYGIGGDRPEDAWNAHEADHAIAKALPKSVAPSKMTDREIADALIRELG